MSPPRQSRCKRRHRLVGKNLYIRKNGTRECRQCSLNRARRYLRLKVA